MFQPAAEDTAFSPPVVSAHTCPAVPSPVCVHKGHLAWAGLSHGAHGVCSKLAAPWIPTTAPGVQHGTLGLG